MTTTFTFEPWCDDPQPRVVALRDCTAIKVPTLFYEDHVERDLASGIVVRRGPRVTEIIVDEVVIDDLLGDADLYAGFTDVDYRENRSVCDSARSTLRLLAKQGHR